MHDERTPLLSDEELDKMTERVERLDDAELVELMLAALSVAHEMAGRRAMQETIAIAKTALLVMAARAWIPLDAFAKALLRGEDAPALSVLRGGLDTSAPAV
ncbi:MAG TPA: hypothetical protein VNJ53_06860 [Gaiellaceae bacterium]|nr:hypothetical protein [Gaiellaceae bacterium]